MNKIIKNKQNILNMIRDRLNQKHRCMEVKMIKTHRFLRPTVIVE